MKNIKMILTDLDCTLLRRNKSVSDYTADVFGRCRGKGIFTAFATSRSETASARFSGRIKPEFFISNGGALARRGEKIVYKAALPSDFANSLIAALRKNPDVLQITVESDKGYLVSQPIDPSWAGWVDYAHAIYTDFSAHVEFGGVYKITYQVKDTLKTDEFTSPEINLLRFTGEDWRQIKANGASKERAAAELAADLGIDLSEVAAFGDDYSDVGMLRNCGAGVAVLNAVAEAKTAADFVCGDCDDDGVAKWIEENVL